MFWVFVNVDVRIRTSVEYHARVLWTLLSARGNHILSDNRLTSGESRIILPQMDIAESGSTTIGVLGILEGRTCDSRVTCNRVGVRVANRDDF